MISGQLFSQSFHLDLGFPSAWSGCTYCLPHFERSLILLSCHLCSDSFTGENQGSTSQCGVLGYVRCMPKPVLAGRCALLSGFRSAICALIRMANARDAFCQQCFSVDINAAFAIWLYAFHTSSLRRVQREAASEKQRHQLLNNKLLLYINS